MKARYKGEAQAPVEALCVAALDVFADRFPAFLQVRDTEVIRLQEMLEARFLEVLESRGSGPGFSSSQMGVPESGSASRSLCKK
jgi:hypothetical protein